MRQYKYDYYTVSVPGDLETTMHGLSQWAINEAKEGARLCVIPCEWLAWPIQGKVGDLEVKIRVRRKRNRKVKLYA